MNFIYLKYFRALGYSPFSPHNINILKKNAVAACQNVLGKFVL